MSASSDLRKALVAVWDDNDLDDVFTAYWAVSDVSEFPVLHDQEASAGQPFPYCVFSLEPGVVVSRMSGIVDGVKQHINEVVIEFRVHTRFFDDVAKSPATIASELIDEIMSIFGGHPTDTPKEPVLDNGEHLQLQYVTDYGTRTGAEEYTWLVRYNSMADVPVAV